MSSFQLAVARPAAGLFFRYFALLALGVSVAAGCAEKKPVASETPKYRPAAAGEPAAAAPAEVATTGTEDPAAAAQDGTARVPAATPGGAASSPPETSAASPYKVPAGDTQQLLSQIDKLSQQQPKGNSREEMIADFQNIQNARLAAVEKVLAGKLDRETRLKMVQTKLDILQMFRQMQLPQADARLQEYVTSLSKGDDPELASGSRVMLFEMTTDRMIREGLSDGKAIVESVKQFLKEEPGSRAAYSAAIGVVPKLAQNGLTEDATAVLRHIAEQLKTEKDPELSSQAASVEAQAKIFEVDISNRLVDVLTGKPDAEAKLLEGVEQLLGEKNPSISYFEPVREVAQNLEYSGQTKLAGQLYDALLAAFKDHENKEIAAAATEMIGRAQKRLDLIGKPFSIEGFKLDGSPFDWSEYAGKVVLVDFWATWCGPCLEEMPNIEQNYAAFKDKGFEVVGVNLNQNIQEVEQFFSLQKMPWESVVSREVLDKKPVENWSQLPMAAKFGVDAIPFIVLVGKDGNVDSLHVRGPKLKTRLTQILGDAEATPRSDPAAEKKPAEEKAANENPAEEKAAEEKPCGTCEDAPTSEEPAKEANPYSARPGLKTDELLSYILKMLDKPKSIQGRPGFCEAVVEACDRVLAAEPPAKEVEFLAAAEAKFETLHKHACNGDEAADKQLAEFVEKCKADPRPRIARQVAFFQQERKVLDGTELPAEKIADLLKELQDFYAKEKLAAKHLRMASSTVALINKLEDGDAREKQFAEFGNLFAKSGDKELARYGKKLAKKPATEESDLIGKELELAGATAGGLPFNWAQYRGKVVLVDFWATWCGPCRREMPHVKALYEKLHDRGLEVVGVSLDKDQEALTQYLEENAIPWETLAGDETQELAEKYGVRGIPTMMLVDKAGKVLGVSHNLAALAPLAEKQLAAR